MREPSRAVDHYSLGIVGPVLAALRDAERDMVSNATKNQPFSQH